MKGFRATATVLLSMALAATAGHAADPQDSAGDLIAQASQGSMTGAYDPMNPRTNPQPLDPMMPGRPAAPQEGESDVALNPELGNLPDTPGVEETFYLCTACHSAATFTQQRLPRSRWDYLWTWMIEKQGMPEQDPETRQAILSYLERHFSWKE